MAKNCPNGLSITGFDRDGNAICDGGRTSSRRIPSRRTPPRRRNIASPRTRGARARLQPNVRRTGRSQGARGQNRLMRGNVNRSGIRRRPNVTPGGRGNNPYISANRDCPGITNTITSIGAGTTWQQARTQLMSCPNTPSVNRLKQRSPIGGHDDLNPEGWWEVCCFLASFAPYASARCCEKVPPPKEEG